MHAPQFLNMLYGNEVGSSVTQNILSGLDRSAPAAPDRINGIMTVSSEQVVTHRRYKRALAYLRALALPASKCLQAISKTVQMQVKLKITAVTQVALPLSSETDPPYINMPCR